METKKINELEIINLYRRGIGISAISHYYSIPERKIERLISISWDIQAYSKSLIGTADRRQLRFIGKIMSKKGLSSQEIISKYHLQPRVYQAWKYAWENGLYEAAVASLEEEPPMKMREIKWSKDPEMRKLQEENERLKAENAYLKKKAELEEEWLARIEAMKRKS